LSGARRREAYAGSVHQVSLVSWLHLPSVVTGLEAPSKCEEGPGPQCPYSSTEMECKPCESALCVKRVPCLFLKLHCFYMSGSLINSLSQLLLLLIFLIEQPLNRRVQSQNDVLVTINGTNVIITRIFLY